MPHDWTADVNDAPPRPVRGLARLAQLILVATLALSALGSAVRSTNSGLACPTWPGCFTAGDFVPALQLNVWLEHSHRLLAGVVALLLAAQLVWVLMRRRHDRVLLAAAAVAAVVVLVQAGLGALVVISLLQAETVTAHLGLALAILACQLVVVLRTAAAERARLRPDVRGRLLRAGIGVSALTYVQMLVGGHVSGVGAGLAYRGEAELGLLAVRPLQTAVQAWNVTHRVLAVALAVAVVAWVVVVRRQPVQVQGRLASLPVAVLGLVGVQVLLGVANIWTELSVLSVVPHLAVGSLIWVGVVWHTLLVWRAERPVDPRQPAAVRALAAEAA